MNGSPTMLLSVLIFLATATLAFSIMAGIRVRGSIKRRASDMIGRDGAAGGEESRTLRKSGKQAAKRIIDYATKHYLVSEKDSADTKVLRGRLVQAGIYDQHGVALFFLARTVLAIGFAAAVFVLMPMLAPTKSSAALWLLIVSAGIVGYIGPSFYLDRRIAARKNEHRAGFPDFMDLLVVCADAGLSMEAALDRVGRELGDSYPSLTANIHIANLEIRAGRTLSEALEHLGERLGLEEARSFATLIQQSDELGSSITDALRVYSDDMRHKRLSRAEEKAYALPSKLSLPMMVCIFPVLFVVIMLPVYIRVHYGNF